MWRETKRGLRVALVAMAAAIAGTACHEAGDTVVSGLHFTGNQAFPASRLSALLVTTATGRLPWARKHYFNRSVFDQDLQRLTAFYADRGYPHAKVTGTDVTFNKDRTAVDLRLRLDEGAPELVERIDLKGFDQASRGVRVDLQNLPLHVNAPNDREVIAASRDRAAFLLKDSGYPHAAVDAAVTAGSGADRVVVTFTASPGDLMTFGDATVAGLKDVQQSVVRRTLTFRPGQIYRESRVTESQQRLGALGLFDFAHVSAATDATASGTPLEIPPAPAAPNRPTGPPLAMAVTVTEGKPQKIQAGVGYGSEEGPRGSLQWTHANFLGGARQLSAEGRYSFRQRGASLDFVEPYLVKGVTFEFTGFAWHNTESTYTSTTRGGSAGITYRFHERRGRNAQPIEHTLGVKYLNQSLAYQITPDSLSDLSQFEERVALGLDPVTGAGNGRVGAIDVDFTRTAVDNQVDAHSGHAASVHVEHAAHSLGGTFRYDDVSAQVRVYVPVGPQRVIAARVHAGAILATDSTDVPFSARYFLGGSSSLRGWGRYQVAPLSEEGLPIGGRSLFESSLEFRTPLTGKFGAVAFLDAGNVWDTPADLRLNHLRVDVGPGLRYTSPIGVVRLDVGYQLRPIPGLVIGGSSPLRRYRLHLSIGQAF